MFGFTPSLFSDQFRVKSGYKNCIQKCIQASNVLWLPNALFNHGSIHCWHSNALCLYKNGRTSRFRRYSVRRYPNVSNSIMIPLMYPTFMHFDTSLWIVDSVGQLIIDSCQHGAVMSSILFGFLSQHFFRFFCHFFVVSFGNFFLKESFHTNLFAFKPLKKVFFEEFFSRKNSWFFLSS